MRQRQDPVASGGEVDEVHDVALEWRDSETPALRSLEVVGTRRRADFRDRVGRMENVDPSTFAVERGPELSFDEERQQIARDLHDYVAHAINLITFHAGTAVLVQDTDTSRSGGALEIIEEVAHDAAAQIDQIVARLRGESSGYSQTQDCPGLAGLDRLVAQYEGIGFVVEVISRGQIRAVSRSTDELAYRVLQEALANASRYGTGAVRVEVIFRKRSVELIVSNPTEGREQCRSKKHPHGLLGMREHTGQLDGEFETEHTHGRFTVRARLPVRESNDVIRVLVVDDDVLTRRGIAAVFASEPQIVIVAEAACGREAAELAQSLEPDVVLMDVRMPDLDGIAAIRELASHAPQVKILILTTFEHDDYIFGALRVGASGFLLKRACAKELIEAVHALAAGGVPLAPSVARRVIDWVACQAATLVDSGGLRVVTTDDRLEELTSREREVFALIAKGLSNAEIAEALIIGEATVKTHVRRLMMKLRLRNRVDAVILAYETGVAPSLRSPLDSGDHRITGRA